MKIPFTVLLFKLDLTMLSTAYLKLNSSMYVDDLFGILKEPDRDARIACFSFQYKQLH